MRLFNSYLPCLDAFVLATSFPAAVPGRMWLPASGLPFSVLPSSGLPSSETEIRCPICGHRLRVPTGAAGRTGRCRACHIMFPIPA